MSQILERTMTSAEKRKDTMLKKKYDDSDMKKNMQAQYGKEEGKKVYFATIRKQAMKKEEVILERQKTNQGHRQSEEQHRSNYGKASIRNVRATGKGGNAASPDERGAAIDARRKAHKEKRGVKTKGMKEEMKVDEAIIAPALAAAGGIAGGVLAGAGKLVGGAISGAGSVAKGSIRAAKKVKKGAEEPVDEEVGISSAVRMKKAREEAMLRLKEKQAVAKKIKKEEVEVVNEVSSKTLRNYIIQGTKDVAKRASDPDSDSGPKYGKKMKRMDGVMTAADKLAKKASKNEEVEIVNEVSKKTLGSYVKKAATEIGTSAMKGDYKKMQKRHKGVLDAADKLKKEEVEQIDELSKTTTANYYYNAKVDKGYVHGGDMGKYAKARDKGLKRAEKKLGSKISKKIASDASKDIRKLNRPFESPNSGAVGRTYKVKEGAYMGPNKEDRKQIKKMDDPSYAKKLANYEKNMDPKKRQELKNKAIKGMKFTHEGTSYGLYKGSGKPGGAMKDYLDKKAEKLKKQRASQSQAARNNPHFDSTQPSPSGRNKYEEVQRDGYGDPIGGPKISKKQKAKNLASNTPDEQHTTTTSEAVTFQHFMEKCWKGYEKKGMKTMFGKRYPNCVKKEDVEFTDEGYGSDRVGPALKVARVIDRVNPKPKMGSKRTAISNMLKMASIKKDEKLRKQKENPYSAKNKLKMVVRSISQNARSKAGATKEEYIPEEGYDIARDMGRVPKTRDKKDATTMPPSEEMKKTQKVYKGPSALELVKKKYGKAIMDVKKK